jgi:hypothetical protein
MKFEPLETMHILWKLDDHTPGKQSDEGIINCSIAAAEGYLGLGHKEPHTCNTCVCVCVCVSFQVKSLQSFI